MTRLPGRSPRLGGTLTVDDGSAETTRVAREMRAALVDGSPAPDGGPDAAGDAGASPTMGAVGALVRRLRVGARLSLAALAATAELSPGLLSQIERGIGNPSFTTLIKLAHALDVPVGRFFVSEERPGALVRRGEHPRLLLAEDNLVYELLTPHMNGRLGMIKAQIAAGWSNESEPYRHEGEECVLVTRGTLRIVLDGDLYVLGEGDSLTYDSGLPHWYHNATEHGAELIGAMTPPSF